MGGNTTIKTKDGTSISAERIPLKKIGRDKFIKKFQRFLLKLNSDFKKVYKHPIWENTDEILNGGIFNGSTSFIMDPNYDSNEIIKYKPSAGDLDVMIPREYAKDVYNFLQKNEGKEFIPGIRYIGNNAQSENKLGNTIICIVNAKFGDISVQAQMDLELSDMVLGIGTDWAKLAHSSAFEDAKAGIKGVAAKFLLRAIVGAKNQIDKNFVVATPSSTINNIKLKTKQPKDIRLLNFGVDSGVGAGYELMMKNGKPVEISGNKVYREKKRSEKSYDKNVQNLMKVLFGIDNLKSTDLHSFISLLNLSNKYINKKTKEKILDRFMKILFGESGQAQYIEPDVKEDIELKSGMYMKAAEILHLKPSKDLDSIIKRYAMKVHGIKERFRRFLNLDENDSSKNDSSKNDSNGNDSSKNDKSEEYKEILKKLINLSIELSNADDDNEKAKIQAEMDKLDNDVSAKKKELNKQKNNDTNTKDSNIQQDKKK